MPFGIQLHFLHEKKKFAFFTPFLGFYLLFFFLFNVTEFMVVEMGARFWFALDFEILVKMN